MSQTSATLSSGHLRRPCPHSTSVTTVLDHFFGKCPHRKLEATRGHLFHCFRIMPYFQLSKKKKSLGEKGYSSYNPSSLVPNDFGLFPKIQFMVKGEIFSVGEFIYQCVPQALKASGPKENPQIVTCPSSSVGRSV